MLTTPTTPTPPRRAARASPATCATATATRQVDAGTQQTADGQSRRPDAHRHSTAATFDPTTGRPRYFGADDNLDSGEHDSSEQIGDGPSDGGAVVGNASRLGARLVRRRSQGGRHLPPHPSSPLVDAGFGSCADGICESIQTQQRVAYQGGGRGHRDVADYQGKEWDPESCGGPSDTAADCGPGGISTWHNKEGTTYVEPGVQVYEDPNPEGSPIGPYPLTAIYAGTCGVIVGGGQVTAPASPLTNSAGQLVISRGADVGPPAALAAVVVGGLAARCSPELPPPRPDRLRLADVRPRPGRSFADRAGCSTLSRRRPDAAARLGVPDARLGDRVTDRRGRHGLRR